jgi:uncharacterized protein YegL
MQRSLGQASQMSSQISSQDDCPICLCPIGGQATFTSSCNHDFHFSCLNQIQRPARCPLCRASIPELDGVGPLQVPVPFQRPYSMPMQSIPQLPSSWASMNGEDVNIQYNLPVSSEQKDLLINTSISMSSATEFNSIGAFIPTTMLCLASLQVPQAPQAQAASVRVPMDLVVVADRSGSMQGTKIALVQQAIQYLLTQMTPEDRLSVIAFNHSVHTVFPLRAGTSEQKSIMSQMVNQHPEMQADGGTEIWSGLHHAIQTIRTRQLTRAVPAILLLTDGQGGPPTRQQLETSLGEVGVTVPVHCFGFGQDHDAPVMSMIAQTGNGAFTYVENDLSLGPSFASCLGGMMSIHSRQVICKVNLAFAATRVTTVDTKYPVTIAPDQRSFEVTFSSLNSGEQRDIPFQIELPELALAGNYSIFEQTVSWTDVNTGTQHQTGPVTTFLQRLDGTGYGTINTSVNIERNRAVAAGAMTEATTLAQSGDLAGARRICQTAMATLQGSVTAGTPQVVALLADLSACLERFISQRTWNSGGYAFLAQVSGEHWNQRSNSDRGGYYTTPSQLEQMRSYTDYSS